MPREPRRVPPGWKHPNVNGKYIPLLPDLADELAFWDEGKEKWKQGLTWYNQEEGYGPILQEYRHYTYEQFAGERPDPAEYMPIWTNEEATHYMMYEITTEGTPISPAFATPEKLAQWLVDNNVYFYARETADYETWLHIITR